MPSLLSFSESEIPGKFIGTTINDLLLCSPSSLVFANKQMKSACVELVIHIFVPLII